MPSAGQRPRALDFPPAVSDAQTSAATTTSATYTATLTGGTAAGVSFTAPTSGKVLIDWASELTNSAISNVGFAAPQVRTGASIGSGTIILGASDDVSTYMEQDAAARSVRVGAHHLLTGLTAGTVYNAQLLHRVTAGTLTCARRTITVMPAP